jgi:hypothetical protein
MNYVVAGGFITATLAVVLLALFAARLLAYRNTHPGPSGGDHFPEFSLVRYEPMLRLLGDEDFEFLASQPGYRPEIGKKLRRNRRHILRLYLRELAADFHRIHALARKIVAESPAENSNLVSVLMRQQIAFWRAMAILEFRLLTPGLGQVDVRGLVEAIESMRLDVRRLAPLSAA